VKGATTALVRRTNLRKAFLAPWHPMVSQISLYCLAYAQHATGMAIHHTTNVVNHHHTIVTPSRDNLPEFTHLFHSMVSRALNVLLMREGFDAPRQIWDSRQTHHLRLLDAEAQFSQLVYDRLNHVAAGLVARPEEMPGFDCHFGRWKAGGHEIEVPDVMFGLDMPRRMTLDLTPTPELYRAYGGQLDPLIYDLQRATRVGARELNRARRRPVRGASEVLRIHPWDEPATLPARGGERVPTFKIGAGGFVGKKGRIRAAKEVTAFRAAHDAALTKWRKGDRGAVFPFATYEMRRLHGASSEVASEDLFLTAEGPTLDEVKAELASGHVVRETGFVEATRAALEEEAEAIHEQEELDMVTPKRGATEVALRHRFDKKGPTPREMARSITRRDKRSRPRRDLRVERPERRPPPTSPSTIDAKPPAKDRDPPR